MISPSDNVPDQSPEAPPGPKSPAESAPSPSPDVLATSSPPAQPVIREKPPDQLAHVPEETGLSVRADAIGHPLPAVEPVVTAVPASLPDQRALDLHHLKLLSYFYYATSGLWLVSMTLALPGAFVGSLGLGLWNLFMGSLNSFIGGCVASTVYSVMMPILLIFGGRFLARQQRYFFCILVAVLACLSLALSTILGIASLIVLFRPTVRGLFSKAKSRAAEAALPVAATASLGESNTTEAELMAKSPPGSDSGDC